MSFYNSTNCEFCKKLSFDESHFWLKVDSTNCDSVNLHSTDESLLESILCCNTILKINVESILYQFISPEQSLGRVRNFIMDCCKNILCVLPAPHSPPTPVELEAWNLACIILTWMPPKLQTRFLILSLKVKIFKFKVMTWIKGGQWVAKEGSAFFPAQKMPLLLNCYYTILTINISYYRTKKQFFLSKNQLFAFNISWMEQIIFKLSVRFSLLSLFVNFIGHVWPIEAAKNPTI